MTLMLVAETLVNASLELVLMLKPFPPSRVKHWCKLGFYVRGGGCMLPEHVFPGAFDVSVKSGSCQQLQVQYSARMSSAACFSLGSNQGLGTTSYLKKLLCKSCIPRGSAHKNMLKQSNGSIEHASFE